MSSVMKRQNTRNILQLMRDRELNVIPLKLFYYYFYLIYFLILIF